MELDGDSLFSAELNLANLQLRGGAGSMIGWPTNGVLTYKPGSLVDLVERWGRKLRDAVAARYVLGSESEESRQGRRLSLVAIEQLIDRLRGELRPANPPPFSADSQDGGLFGYLAWLRYPFIVSVSAITSWEHPSDESRGRALWADAAGLPHNTRFNLIYGALLRAAEGHPIYGDQDYKRLQALLAEALESGHRFVRLGTYLFMHSDGRWRAVRADTTLEGEATWVEGEIISRNFGRLIVPPHWRAGELVPGYTRNGPGEGPSLRRPVPLHMQCVERPISGTDLAWLHGYHAWDLNRH